MVWLLALNNTEGWAGDPNSVACQLFLESQLGGYLPHTLADWAGSRDFVMGVRSGALCADPDVWTDGGLVLDEVSGVSSGGAGVYALSSGSCWFQRSMGQCGFTFA